MTRTEVSTLYYVVHFFRQVVREDAMRESLHALGFGDEMITDALAALEREGRCRVHSPNSQTTCDGCRESLQGR